MAKYFMFGNYSAASLKDINADRTRQALSIIEKLGGSIDSVYALLGGNDLVVIAELPDNKVALKASIMLTQLSGISFSTAPALAVDLFDQLAS